MGPREALARLRTSHLEPEKQDILNHQAVSQRIYTPTEHQARLRALEATSEVVTGMRRTPRPSWPPGKRGRGSDTDGNLWGRPLCRWRKKCRIERG